MTLEHQLHTQAKHPSVLDRFDEFVSTLRGKRLAVFLDYDGESHAVVSARLQ